MRCACLCEVPVFPAEGTKNEEKAAERRVEGGGARIMESSLLDGRLKLTILIDHRANF